MAGGWTPGGPGGAPVGGLTLEPRWLQLAYEEMRRGVREVAGPAANPRIVEYHSSTSLKATSDEVAWCAAFVGWCLETAGVRASGSAAARSYLTWGAGLSPAHPPVGAVMVLARGNGGQPGADVTDAPGHVGFFFGWGEPGRILLLGGNQGDQVSIGSFPVHRLLGVRWAT